MIQVGSVVEAEDMGMGVVKVMEGDELLVDWEECGPIWVAADSVTETDIPEGYGSPTRAMDHIVDWF